MANVGKMAFYGRPRIGRSRLLDVCNAADAQILVEPGLGWLQGDMIGLAPTTINWWETDYAYIVSYDNTSGLVTLDRQLSYYHWGQS